MKFSRHPMDNPLLELRDGKPHFVHSATCGNGCDYACNPRGFEQAEEIKKALQGMCKGEDGEICPECHHRLRCEEDRDVDTGVCHSAWLECPNCHFKGSVMEPLPAVTVAELASERKCLKCGCTDDCACDVGPNGTCSWVCESVDLCSACLPPHLTPLFDEICLLEEMMESAGIVLSARVDAAHAILKGEAK
jgi:hypothetical protein